MQLPGGIASHLLGMKDLVALGSPGAASSKLGVALPAKLANAASKRQFEYLAGRACAVQALQEAGWAGTEPIGTRAAGAPDWPSGYAGSIAHGAGYAWAVAAASCNWHGLGIDVESRLTEVVAVELRDQILSPAEQFPARAAGADFATFVSVVFSAKESIYKCLQPLTGAELGFLDVECLGFSADRQHLDFMLRRGLDAEFHAGRELRALIEIRAECVMTAVMVGGTGIEPVASTV